MKSGLLQLLSGPFSLKKLSLIMLQFKRSLKYLSERRGHFRRSTYFFEILLVMQISKNEYFREGIKIKIIALELSFWKIDGPFFWKLSSKFRRLQKQELKIGHIENFPHALPQKSTIDRPSNGQFVQKVFPFAFFSFEIVVRN